MNINSGQLDRRAYLKTTGLATAGMVGLAGCTSDGDLNGADDEEADTGETDDNGDGDAFGTLSTSITDQPNDIGDFDELLVTIDGIWVLPAAGDEEEQNSDDDEEADDTENGDNGENENGAEADDPDTEDNGDDEDEAEDEDEDEDAEDAQEEADREGRRYIEFDDSQIADLVELQGDNTQLIDETELEVGDYRYLQLDVSDTEGTLTDGETAEVETPGNSPLLFREEFEIRADETTRFIADFAPMRRGQGSYIIRPVATGTKVLYGDEEYTVDDDDADGENGNGDADDDETNGDDSNDGEQNESTQNGQPDDS